MLIPLPKYKEETADPKSEYTVHLTPGEIQKEMDRVRKYLDVPNWTCEKCGAVMFGRMEHCVYCKVRLSTLTPRPAHFPTHLL